MIHLTLAYCAGLLLGHGFLYFPYSTGGLVILGILIAGVSAWLFKLTPHRVLHITLPCLIGMAAYIYSAAWLPSDHYTRLFPAGKILYEIRGEIASPLDRDPDRTGFVLKLSRIDSTPVSGNIHVSVREAAPALGYGDTITFSGKLFEPRGYNNPGGFDYPAYLARNGVYYTVSVKSADEVETLSRGTGVFRKIQDLRERIRQAFLASTSGPGSAILQAMVLGEEGGLTDELRDRFMAAGVTHIISISGSHLGMAAILCFGLIRGLMFLMPERWYHRLTLYADPKKIAAWLTLPLVIFYTLLAGGQVATIRSLVMIAFALFALILDRDHALMHSLAAAALLLLIINPQALFDISFQLSFLSVLVIAFVVALWNDLGVQAPDTLRKLRNNAVLLIAISLSTSLATGPLVAHYFNQFSFAGILSNMVVVPFAGLAVVPLGLFSGLLSLFTGRLPLPGLNQLVSDVFIDVVSFFSRLPFAQFHPASPGMIQLALAAVFLWSLAVFVKERLLPRFKPFEYSSRTSRTPVVGMSLSAALLLLTHAYASLPDRTAVASFPDVGQGDCALIELASGKTILIDGGGSRDNRFDVGRRVLAPFLWNKGIHKLDLVILSHPHPDHMNGLGYLVTTFAVAEVWDSGRDPGLPGYDEFRRSLVRNGIARKVVSSDSPPLELGEAEVRVLHPAPHFEPRDKREYSAENSRSLVVRIACEGRVFLFTGDIGGDAENALARTGHDLKCDLLKVPHHGSKSSSSDAFVSLTRPAAAVVTVGKGNPYRHPSDEVVARYEKIGARVLRTDRDGAVNVRFFQGRLETTRWNDLALRRIELSDPANWGLRDRENRRRVYRRLAPFVIEPGPGQACLQDPRFYNSAQGMSHGAPYRS